MGIEKLLVGFDEEQKKQVLGQAWEACCDGEWLQENFNIVLYTTTDPWRSNDEDLWLEIEECAVREVVEFIEF